MKIKTGRILITCLLSLQIFGCGKEELIFEEETSFLAVEEEATSEENFTETVGEIPEESPQYLSIHVCGAVEYPSVYQVKEGTRIYQAIEAAGGFTQEADQEYLNLALEVEDGMQIRIPTKEEVANAGDSLLLPGETTQKGTGKVNLNTADEELLCTLPGIGESRAKSIIQYRQEHGNFQKVEDIMKVSGIKDGAYEKIKDLITVTK